ncbi:HEAT repeat domain-containing protein [Chloroflexota bacterium]
MDSEITPLKETIAELSNSDKPLLYSRLADLSNLNPAELAAWEQAWATIEPERQRQIMSRLIELAEDNVELDFKSIFRSRLEDRDSEVQSKAINGLWESEDASLVDPLIHLLEQAGSEQVQAAAAAGLGKFAMLAEHNKLRSSHTDKICQALLTAINDKNLTPEVRLQALAAAAPLSRPRVKEAIATAYRSHDTRGKINAIYAMGKNSDRSWLPILLEELSSDDTATRYEAAVACGELGEEAAVPLLIRLTDDADTDVQLSAFQALGKIGGAQAKTHLQHCRKNPGEVIRQAAEQALEELSAGEDPLSFKF